MADTSKTYAVVNNSTGVVENIIVIRDNQVADFEVEGCTIVHSVEASIGFIHDKLNGGFFPPADPDPVAPSFAPLSPVEFRNALIDADIMPADVTAAISQIQDVKEREKALNYWNYPTMFHRDNPLIEQIADGFGLSPDDVDQMWLDTLALRS